MKLKLSLSVAAISLAWGATEPSADAQLIQNNTQKGAVVGGTTGAVLGGVIGHQNDRTGKGALIGGVAGAIAGGLLGNAHDAETRRQYEYQQMRDAQYAHQMSRAVSIGDAVSMSNSGISPQVIISQIRANGVQQEIGVQEIIYLHQNGVAEPVIQEMQRARIGTATPAPVERVTPVYVPPRPTVIVEPAPVIYRPVPAYRFDFHYGPPRHSYHHHHRHGHW